MTWPLKLEPEAWVSTLTQCATWRGKSSDSPVWSRRWKKTAWLRHLCGSVTYGSSMVAFGLEELTSSAPGSLARTSQEQDEGLEYEGRSQAFGEKSSVWLAKWGPCSSSWKTPPPSKSEASTSSSVTWPRSGSMRNGIVYPQSTLALPTSAIGGSLLPTPVAVDTGHRRTRYAQGGRALSFVLGGPTNPRFLEWMMGLPPGLTDVEPSETPSALLKEG